MHRYILTTSSIVLCPHGGIVNHLPMSGSQFLIEGMPPMLLNDTYLVSCPGSYHGPGMNCLRVEWTNPSFRLFVNNIPALHNESLPLIYSVSGVPIGAAIVSSFQTSYPEPVEVKNVH